MFTSKRHTDYIDIQDCFYYRKQQKLKRKKYYRLLLLLALMVAITFTLGKAFATEQSLAANNLLINAPQLIFDCQISCTKATLPVDSDAQITISGLVAYTTVKQTFINPYSAPQSAKYQFPLPSDAAVKHMHIKMRDVKIEGKILEKQQAKHKFQQAKQQGKKASLVTQQRANLFTNQIANIPANAQVVVSLTFISPVQYSHGQLSLNLPLTSTTRYTPAHYFKSPTEEYLAQTPTIATLAKSQASITIALDAKLPIAAITSSSHKIKAIPINNQNTAYLISLVQGNVIANKQFNLSWQLTNQQHIQASNFSEKINDHYYHLLTLFPPKINQQQTLARDIIFVIDTSGSMQGQSMQQAKQSLLHALSLLNRNDSFNIIAFNNTSQALFQQTQLASPVRLTQAKNFIAALSADGGTEMYRPLSSALLQAKSNQQSVDAIRQIIFITDGAVANEFELMQLLTQSQQNFRLYTVGIGAAPNGYFMKKAAQFGRGSYTLIQSPMEVTEKMNELLTTISQPVLTDIKLMLPGHQTTELTSYPEKIPDLHSGKPIQIAIQSTQPIKHISLTAKTKQKIWTKNIDIDNQQLAKGITSLWARRKIEDLVDSLVIGAKPEKVKQQVIATSIAHQVLSPYTSFIAIEQHTNNNDQLAKPSKLIAQQNYVKLSPPQTALNWQQQLFIGLFILFAITILNLKSIRHYVSINH